MDDDILAEPPQTAAAQAAACAGLCCAAVAGHPVVLLWRLAQGLPLEAAELAIDLRRVGNLWGTHVRSEQPCPGWELSSRFEGGSMGPIRSAAPGSFEVDAVRDPGGGNNRMWWHFEVRRENCRGAQALCICVKNLPRQSSLYRPATGLAHCPVVAVPGEPFRPVAAATVRFHVPPASSPQDGAEPEEPCDASLSFEHQMRAGESVARFCFTYPYSHTEGVLSAARWAAQHSNGPAEAEEGPAGGGSDSPALGGADPGPGVLLSVQTLCLTRDGHECPLLTVTGPAPHGQKQYCVISARVHSGEVPASFIAHGILSALLDDSPQMSRLRSRFIFKIVPALNPDGVVRGYSRGDRDGVNLNRVYEGPDPALHPTAWAMVELLSAVGSTGRCALYVDLHAHANKRGAFFYGNALESAAASDLQRLFAMLVQLRAPHFDYVACNFSERLMAVRDRAGQSRRGAARVVAGRLLGIPLVLTLECNYSQGDSITARTAGGSATTCRLSRGAAPLFCPATFGALGRSLLLALLDLQRDCDPIPVFTELGALRKWIARGMAPSMRPTPPRPASKSAAAAPGKGGGA